MTQVLHESEIVPETHEQEHCLTCSDDATQCTVVRPPADALGTTLVDTGKGTEEVDTTLVGHVVIGDTVLVHAKTAIAKLGEQGQA